MKCNVFYHYCLRCVGIYSYSSRFQFKTNHPAVTLEFMNRETLVYDVDLVPAIKVMRWPGRVTGGWEQRSRNGKMRTNLDQLDYVNSVPNATDGIYSQIQSNSSFLRLLVAFIVI